MVENAEHDDDDEYSSLLKALKIRKCPRLVKARSSLSFYSALDFSTMGMFTELMTFGFLLVGLPFSLQIWLITVPSPKFEIMAGENETSFNSSCNVHCILIKRTKATTVSKVSFCVLQLHFRE